MATKTVIKSKKRRGNPRGIVFPPDIEKRIIRDAQAARRSFSGQVHYMLDIALKALGE